MGLFFLSRTFGFLARHLLLDHLLFPGKFLIMKMMKISSSAVHLTRKMRLFSGRGPLVNAALIKMKDFYVCFMGVQFMIFWIIIFWYPRQWCVYMSIVKGIKLFIEICCCLCWLIFFTSPVQFGRYQKYICALLCVNFFENLFFIYTLLLL